VNKLIPIILTSSALTASSVSAAITITLEEVGSDLVLEASGSVNLSALTYGDEVGYEGIIYPQFSTLVAGPAETVLGDAYEGTLSGDAFGSSIGPQFATGGSGDLIGIAFGFGNVVVPAGYVSGSPLSATSTFANTSLADLDIAPGVYSWTWGSGADADSATLTAVPEPATYAALAGAFALGLALWNRRRR